MRQVKPSGDFLVPVVVSGHDAVAKVSDFAKGAGLAQVVTDAAVQNDQRAGVFCRRRSYLTHLGSLSSSGASVSAKQILCGSFIKYYKE